MNRRDARALYEISAVAMHDAVQRLTGVMRDVVREALDERDGRPAEDTVHVGQADLDDLRGRIAQAMKDLQTAEATAAALTERAETAERDYQSARLGQETAQREADAAQAGIVIVIQERDKAQAEAEAQALLKEAAEERVKALEGQCQGLRKLLDRERASAGGPGALVELTETAELIKKLADQGRDNHAISRIVNARRQPADVISMAGIAAIREMVA